jgi:hypothetical protein
MSQNFADTNEITSAVKSKIFPTSETKTFFMLSRGFSNSAKVSFRVSNQLLKNGFIKPDRVQRESLDDASLIGLTGGEIFHEMMLRHNVKCVFGYPGGAILPVYDAIYNSEYFDFVLPRHEQGAGHMAEGYARASGKPGVVLVTSGIYSLII